MQMYIHILHKYTVQFLKKKFIIFRYAIAYGAKKQDPHSRSSLWRIPKKILN